MGIEKLIAFSAVLASLAAFTGQLPRIIYSVHLAELRLLKESQSSRWGIPMLLPVSNGEREIVKRTHRAVDRK